MHDLYYNIDFVTDSTYIFIFTNLILMAGVKIYDLS